MALPPFRHCLACLVSLATLASTALGQDQPATASQPEPSVRNRTLIQKLIERVETLEIELGKLRQAGKTVVPTDPAKQRVVAMVESAFLGAPYYRTTGNRFLAAKLVLVNLTNTPLTVSRQATRLKVDGKQHMMPTAIPSTIRTASFQVGNQSFQVSSLKWLNEITLPAGGSGSTWVIFSQLPQGPSVPKLSLSLGIAKTPVTIDLNARARAKLAMSTRRIGPRGSLGLVTIGGPVDTINIAELVDQLDTLVTAGVVRSVIQFTDKAPPIESRIYSWLNQAASLAGQGTATGNTPFPRIPAAIRELHLAAIPNQRNSSRTSSSVRRNVPGVMMIQKSVSPNPFNNRVRVHKTVEHAVSASLASAYRVLPRGELLEEIRQGDPLTRPAALAWGGGRLRTEDLPLLLSLTNDDSQVIAQAATVSLRHFGEPAAVGRLRSLALQNQPGLSITAFDSLAASRYPAAHESLLKMLAQSDIKARKEIVSTMAQYPRPAFADAIHRFATDAETDATLSLVAMKALAQIGHPGLITVLEEAVQGSHPARRDTALTILVTRPDRKSQQLAMEHVLKRLETAPPDNTMNALLLRTRDPRAIPMLLKHLTNSTANRGNLVKTLVAIGDQDIAAKLLEHYPKLSTTERATVLRAIGNNDIKTFRKLAPDALASNNSSLISAACTTLQQDASPEAVAMLVKAFDSTNSSTALNYIANALSAVGTPEARKVLENARSDKNANKRNYAKNALRTLMQRSPGYQYISMGRHYSQQLDWKQALTQYNLAIKIDPRHSAAYAGRGNARLQMKDQKLEDVRKDFLKAVELDPFNSQAMTGMAILLLREGKLDAGLKYAEDSQKQAISSSTTIKRMYAYNLACVYSRAIELIVKDDKIGDRDNKLASCRKKALSQLELAIKYGWRDKTWLNKDPDLKAVRTYPEFKKIFGTPAAKPTAKPGTKPAVKKALKRVTRPKPKPAAKPKPKPATKKTVKPGTKPANKKPVKRQES
ncbi:MAG: hypothetical protein VX304_00440 [Planctomycetota bacterium]|nr:hypothetical protein [Planctomycetota bacterium]